MGPSVVAEGKLIIATDKNGGRTKREGLCKQVKCWDKKGNYGNCS